jgi:hypothetical protein
LLLFLPMYFSPSSLRLLLYNDARYLNEDFLGQVLTSLLS